MEIETSSRSVFLSSDELVFGIYALGAVGVLRLMYVSADAVPRAIPGHSLRK